MRDVTLVEVHSDGEHLVLADASGEQYLLKIDDQLRAAARRDVAWLNRLRVHDTEALRPRDIQARIRAGMNAEELAQVTGMPIEHIRRYEGPVLAERQHIAATAQRVAVSRSSNADTTLEESVRERLATRGGSEATDWDSWREDSGAWIVQVSFEAGGRPRAAQWRYLVSDATLEPLDDESRWLTAVPQPQAQPQAGVQERVYDVAADGGVRETTPDKPNVRSDPDSGARTLEDPQARTLDLLDALRGRRGRRQPVGDGDPGEQPDLVDALLDVDETAPPPAHPAASAPHEAVDAAILALPEPAEPAAGPATAPAEDAAEPGPRRRARASKRATVPSWDDIMFGAKKD